MSYCVTSVMDTPFLPAEEVKYSHSRGRNLFPVIKWLKQYSLHTDKGSNTSNLKTIEDSQHTVCLLYVFCKKNNTTGSVLRFLILTLKLKVNSTCSGCSPHSVDVDLRKARRVVVNDDLDSWDIQTPNGQNKQKTSEQDCFGFFYAVLVRKHGSSSGSPTSQLHLLQSGSYRRWPWTWRGLRIAVSGE